MTTDAVSGLLELHVLNAGYGESIILHLPNGEWGVVDCCAASIADPDTNPAIQFLKHHGVDKIEFLCLTHPHDDHYRGMSQFFDLFTINYFWRFAGMTREGLLNLAKLMEVKEGKADFRKTLQRVSECRGAKSLQTKQMSDIKPLYPVPYSEDSVFKISSIAPSTGQVEAFEESLKACFDEDGCLFQKSRNSTQIWYLRPCLFDLARPPSFWAGMWRDRVGKTSCGKYPRANLLHTQ